MMVAYPELVIHPHLFCSESTAVGAILRVALLHRMATEGAVKEGGIQP